MNEEREKMKQEGLAKLIEFQDLFLKDKKKAEEHINYMPCWMLDEDHMILLRQKATQEMYSPFFDEGFDAGIKAERERFFKMLFKFRSIGAIESEWKKLFPQEQEK